MIICNECWVNPDDIEDVIADPNDHAPYCDQRIHVNCDDKCGALMKPETPLEIAHALNHWRHHAWSHGCSHAR